MFRSLLVFLAIFFISFYFLQAENNIRAVKIKYLVYNSQTGKYDKEIDAKDGYEILPDKNKKYSGQNKIIPVGIFQNVTANKELQFYVGAEISNAFESKVVYTKQTWVSANYMSQPGSYGIYYCDSLGNPLPYPTPKYQKGLPPGGYAKVIFYEFIPNEIIASNRGKLNLTVFSRDFSYPDNIHFSREDHSDDTLKTSVESIGILDYLNINMSDTLSKNGIKIPSPYVWVNKGVEIVDGNQFCNQPINSVDINYNNGINVSERFSPVYRMNRLALDGTDEAAKERGGDTLISNIIDMRVRYGAIFNFMLERTGKTPGGFPRGWCDSLMYGPEHRAVDVNGGEIRKPDKLVFEIIYSDSNHLDKLINPKESDWTNHPSHNGLPPVTNNPILSIFGGGGLSIGYMRSDSHDSALTPAQGLRADYFDDGKDNFFKSYNILIPDTMISYGGYCRLRIRVEAENNGVNGIVQDDADDFYIDRLHTFFRCECGDEAINSINIKTPYKILPMKDSIKIPVSVNISNTSSTHSPTFLILLSIKHKDDPDFKAPPYSKYVQVLFMKPYDSKEVDFPQMTLGDFKKYLKPGENKFQALAYYLIPGGDMEPENDTIYTEFSIFIDKSYAYDLPGGKNDVEEFAKIKSRGLNLTAYASGDYSEDYAFGKRGGYGAGIIYSRYELLAPDTVYGFQVWFGSLSMATEFGISLYDDNNGVPNSRVANSIIYKKRGYDDFYKQQVLDNYSTYLYAKPVILKPGRYWAAISQIGDNGIELGGSADRMGMSVMVVDNNANGNKSSSLIIDKNFRKCIKDTNGSIINYDVNNYFSFKNSNGYVTPFLTNTGNPAFAHHDRYGNITNEEGTVRTYSRGSFIPMLRLYVDGSHYDWNSSVNDNNNELSFEIYPEPVTDMLIMNLPVSSNVANEITIYNEIGNTVYRSSEINNNIIINTNDFNPGTYFCKVVAGNKSAVKKFVLVK